MTLATVGQVAGILAALAAVITLYYLTREAARKRAEAERVERDGIYQDGRKSRDDEVALLRSQRDDARRERDSARGESTEWERRYLDQRDRREP